MESLFNKEVLDYSTGVLMTDINELLEDYLPEGKALQDFTGGYIQQLKNSNQFIAFFGTKQGTKNRHSIRIKIQDDEVDLFYMMLKAKIHQMKNESSNTVSISMAQRKLDRLNNKEGGLL